MVYVLALIGGFHRWKHESVLKLGHSCSQMVTSISNLVPSWPRKDWHFGACGLKTANQRSLPEERNINSQSAFTPCSSECRRRRRYCCRLWTPRALYLNNIIKYIGIYIIYNITAKSCVRLWMILWIKDCVVFSDIFDPSTTNKLVVWVILARVWAWRVTRTVWMKRMLINVCVGHGRGSGRTPEQRRSVAGFAIASETSLVLDMLFRSRGVH